MASITVDTNILVRIAVDDDPRQSTLARLMFERSATVVVPIVALCEFVWVVSRSYRLPLSDIAAMIRRLMSLANVRADMPLVEAGLAVLDAGGDFADGVIAHDGLALGGLTFVTFDRAAVLRLTRLGVSAAEPSDM